MCAAGVAARVLVVGFGWHNGGMSIPTVAGAHDGTLRMSIHDVTRQLNAGLGPTLVAALTGTRDRKLPIRWARADGPEPGPDFRRRLLLAHRVWAQIATQETEHVARVRPRRWGPRGGGPRGRRRSPSAREPS